MVASSSWTCSKCKRVFTQRNQRHACGTGERAQVLRNRPDTVVKVYQAIERFVQSLGKIEIVARERYVLFRSTRIFADLVIMADAVRVAIHLGREVKDPMFIKVVSDRKKVTHVVKLTQLRDVTRIRPLLKEAYEFSISAESRNEAQDPA
ncbi:MAG: DUF5655 domain-containing protein [Myxococcota bacterium]